MTKGEGRRDRRRFLKSREEINGGSQPPGLLPVPGDDGLGVSHRSARVGLFFSSSDLLPLVRSLTGYFSPASLLFLVSERFRFALLG
ncbi:hypothetical protein L2E82_33727 [Cichorium intybus]|uniref:Uncharacterized protein n=1 Tax=Cichorium intybus TaxID=13427 RepID=A0ACB9BKY6_CICIN|nr:hypothetical protein L2E82_33727 [Cichorium intybus]